MSINFFCKPMSGQESFHISPKLSQKVIFVFRMLSDSDHVRVQMSETQYLMEMMTIFFISCNKFYIVMTSDCDIKVLKVGPLSPLYLLSLSLILILYSNLLFCFLFIICIPRKFNVKWFCNNLSIRTRIGRILMRKISEHHCISIVFRP